MKTERVEFWSAGARLRGLLRLPDGKTDGPLPYVVQGPGWLGLADAALYLPYHEAFTAAGFAVLIFDYRGFGESEGDRGVISPARQLEDWRNALCYLAGRPDMDPSRAAVFGSGGTGGGNAVLVAALEPGVRAAISQVPVADGRDWLHRMRQEHEWIAFLASLAEDRRRRAATGDGATVHPRQGIMVETPERRATNVKADVDTRIPTEVPLACAQEILEYRPLDAAPRVRGLLIVAVADDAVTPTDHAIALYEAAAEPKRLLVQRGATHYAAYKQYAGLVIPEMVDWLREHVVSGPIEVRGSTAGAERLRWLGGTVRP